jgi:hypothetical protein
MKFWNAVQPELAEYTQKWTSAMLDSAYKNDFAEEFGELMFLNAELFRMIENSISLDLLARLYSSQLITRGDKHLLDHNRTYYKLLRQIIQTGQQKGQLRSDVTANEMVKVYALCERALIYDWCLSNGDYSLSQYGKTMLPMFLSGLRKNS